MSEAAFYCVADERYFLGAVGLVNSLRLQGHSEPIYLLDCGLSERQRELIAPEVELVAGPRETPPWLLKTVAPLAHPAEVMVLIDTDMIATRPLGELIEAAAGGRVVAFRNDRQRFFAQWGELTGLGPATRRPYVSSGLVALGPGIGGQLLELLERLQPIVDFERTYWRRNERGYPFLYADQDVLNAILATRLDPRQLTVLDERLAATLPFRGLRITDPDRVRCAYGDGVEPFVLHHFAAKPWLVRRRANPYSRLLTRLLLGSGAPVRLRPEQLPRRLRSGAAGRAERMVTDLALAVPGAARRLGERGAFARDRESAR